MAWPPPTMDESSDNLDNMADFHPGLHNDVAAAINDDIVPEVNSVRSRLDTIEGRYIIDTDRSIIDTGATGELLRRRGVDDVPLVHGDRDQVSNSTPSFMPTGSYASALNVERIFGAGEAPRGVFGFVVAHANVLIDDGCAGNLRVRLQVPNKSIDVIAGSAFVGAPSNVAEPLAQSACVSYPFFIGDDPTTCDIDLEVRQTSGSGGSGDRIEMTFKAINVLWLVR